MLCLDQWHGENASFYNGDCVEITRQMPDNSVDMILYSPPFSSVYTYSGSLRDMGNCDSDEEFLAQYAHLVTELYRLLRPGRICVVHCKDLVYYKSSRGSAGLRDFPGDIVRAHTTGAGRFDLHSKVTIWKCPVTEMQRTKAHGLLFKQLRKDASISRQGCAEYLMVFRKWPRTEAEHAAVRPVTHWGPTDPGFADQSAREPFPVNQWQQWASPVWESKPSDLDLELLERWLSGVWMDIDQTNVLNVAQARDDKDEKHMCLARGSLVLTWGGYRPIEDLAVGDMVLTHRGRWRPVTAKACMGVKPTITTTAQGVAHLRTTPDHRLWTRKASTSHPRAVARKAEPGWVDAEQTLGSYLNLKLPPIVESSLSEHEWWVIGRWLGDGHRDTRGRIHISCGNHETAVLVEKLGSLAGSVAQTRTGAQIALKDRSGRLRAFLSRCGQGAAGKMLPGEAISLDPVKAEALLSGYLSADGHYVAKVDRWTASSVSRALILGMAMVAQRARGVAASAYAGRKAHEDVIEGRCVNAKDDWILGIPPRNVSAMMLEDGAWKKVRRIEPAGEIEVWDISVEEDASFTAEGCVVKNCPLQLDVIERAVSLWSNPGDVVLSPFGGIGSEGVGSLAKRRKFAGIELKESYWKTGCATLSEADRPRQRGLFGGGAGGG